MAVEWVDEVPDRRRVGKWHRICDELRSKPGHWAKVYTASNTAFATMLKKGELGGSKPGEFEATCRRSPDGKYDIYARYVGLEAATKAAPGGSKSLKAASAEA